jgi:hypothetical protein
MSKNHRASVQSAKRICKPDRIMRQERRRLGRQWQARGNQPAFSPPKVDFSDHLAGASASRILNRDPVEHAVDQSVWEALYRANPHLTE